jgi:hypothetical protein
MLDMNRTTAPRQEVESSQGIIAVPLSLVRRIGVFLSFMLCYLWQKKDDPFRKEFAISISNVEKETGISEYLQRHSLKELQSYGFTSTILKGRVPRKRHVHFHIQSFDEIINKPPNPMPSSP